MWTKENFKEIGKTTAKVLVGLSISASVAMGHSTQANNLSNVSNNSFQSSMEKKVNIPSIEISQKDVKNQQYGLYDEQKYVLDLIGEHKDRLISYEKSVTMLNHYESVVEDENIYTFVSGSNDKNKNNFVDKYGVDNFEIYDNMKQSELKELHKHHDTLSNAKSTGYLIDGLIVNKLLTADGDERLADFKSSFNQSETLSEKVKILDDISSLVHSEFISMNKAENLSAISDWELHEKGDIDIDSIDKGEVVYAYLAEKRQIPINLIEDAIDIDKYDLCPEKKREVNHYTENLLGEFDDITKKHNVQNEQSKNAQFEYSERLDMYVEKTYNNTNSGLKIR